MSVLVIDNYDSFTYNLVQLLWWLGARVEVRRNDAVTLAEAVALGPQRVVISPGPGRPDSAGITLALIEHLAGRVPILGVCLGHQAIGQVFGGRIVRAPVLMHGKTSWIHHDGRGVLHDLPDPFEATRYHSLVIEPASVPACLDVTAHTTDGVIMGVRHRELAIEGVQFHPESILTAVGPQLIANFLGVLLPPAPSHSLRPGGGMWAIR